MQGAIYVSGSKNSKLSSTGSVDCTYSSIEATCPTSCELRNSGCYAKQSYVGIVNSRLNKEAIGFSKLQVARSEARCIDSSYAGAAIPHDRHMRLHVSGDSTTIKGSKLINSAVGRWKKRGDGSNKVWSYTHAWQTIPKKIWSNVSMLASIDKVEQASFAREQGYAPAIVVSQFDGDKVFTLDGSATKWIPCPAQTKEKVTCASCNLCTRSEFLYQKNMGIAFQAHGVKTKEIKRRLNVVK
jgi:hypothetical protein